MRAALLLALAAGCHRASEQEAADPVRPIVIWWTVDTLGERAAEETGWCELLASTLGAYGRDVDCLGGAVPPSSWTAESHTRFLWPQHLVGEGRSQEKPSCDAISVLQAVKAQQGVRYVWAADNPAFGFGSIDDGAPILCEDGRRAWVQGSDAAWLVQEGSAVMELDEADTPVHAGMDALLAEIDGGSGAVAYFNDYESGGHWPRCFDDPYSAPCDALWELGVAEGLVAPDDSRYAAWWRPEFEEGVTRAAIAAWGDDPEQLRSVIWATLEQSITHFRGIRFLPRLERLLAGLEERDRLEDLVLVVAGDHGENPCVASEISGAMDCDHFGLPNEWTGRVPVFVSPASTGEIWRASGLVGDRETPWALANVSYALLGSLGGEIPSSWPAPEPVGRASSWTCRNGSETALHVSGDASVRCELDSCGAWSWSYPEELGYAPLPVPVPDDLVVYTEAVGDQPNWVRDACQ